MSNYSTRDATNCRQHVNANAKLMNNFGCTYVCPTRAARRDELARRQSDRTDCGTPHRRHAVQVQNRNRPHWGDRTPAAPLAGGFVLLKIVNVVHIPSENFSASEPLPNYSCGRRQHIWKHMHGSVHVHGGGKGYLL